MVINMKSKLKTRELSSIIINLIMVKMLFTYPRFLVVRCKNGAWIPIIVFGAVVFGIFYLTQWLYMKTGRISILSQAEAIGGKALKIIVGLFTIALLAADTAPMVRAFPEAVKTALLQNSGMMLIVTMMTIGLVVGTYNGIEALGRVASIFLPVAWFFLIGFLIILIPNFNVNNLFPLSITESITKGPSALSIFSDIIVINFLLPYCNNMQTVKKAGMTAIIAGGLISVIITATYCLVYPYPTSSEFIVPMYQLARIVTIGTYFQRLEAVFEFVWSISMFLYASVYLFVICDIFRRIFDLKHYKPIVFPAVIILWRVAFSNESYADTIRNGAITMTMIYPFLYALPLIFCGFYYAKQNKKKL